MWYILQSFCLKVSPDTVLLSEIRLALAEQGYKLQIYPTDNNTSVERAHLESLLDNPPCAVIVEGCKSTLPNPNLDLYEKLRENGTFILDKVSEPLYNVSKEAISWN